MISNYLTSKRKATNVSDNAGNNEVGRPEPKMSKKITSLIRFSREKTPNRIKDMEKYKPSGDWRKITQNQLHIYY